MDLILASSSTYRKILLERLGLPFRCVNPNVDEAFAAGETSEGTAARLALAKAQAVAEQFPEALVIGSDQVAALDGASLGKPGSFARAKAQLQASSGRELVFSTGLALVRRSPSLTLCTTEHFKVRFRVLTEEQIECYLRADEPFDCAGSFKVESLGIALFQSLCGDDPTALEGLPLIALTSLLQQAGVDVLSQQTKS